MLGSVLKQIVWRKRAKAAEIPAEGGGYYSAAQTERWMRDKAERLRTSLHMGYPYLVHLETLASCNAACGFCPYPNLERKNARMPDDLIEKIVDDLTAVPQTVPFSIAPYKVSEPFLETRLFDILQLIRAKLPSARIYLSSNAAPITEKKIDLLERQTHIQVLTLSVNSHDPAEYEAVMKIPFARTYARLVALHERAAAGAFGFPVRITRVTAGREADERFVAWVKRNFPAFSTAIFARNDWIGTAVTEGAHDIVPDAPCHRWFDMSIMATGEVAMCCMDGEGRYIKGNARTQHVLEIYNQPWLVQLRNSLISRLQAGDPCSRCTYVSW